jgi:hypothetical protein
MDLQVEIRLRIECEDEWFSAVEETVLNVLSDMPFHVMARVFLRCQCATRFLAPPRRP